MEESKKKLLNHLKGIEIGCNNITVDVPITTNKLKNLCEECIEWVSYSSNKEKLDSKILYRVTLTHLSYQLCRSKSVKPTALPSGNYNYKTNFTWFYKYEGLIRICDKNCFPLAHLINSVGVYTLNGINFQAFIPPAIEEDGQIIPDPFKVSILNLYEFVRYLSQADTKLEIRQYFHKYDPFPDAKWSDDGTCILLNPTEIITENYNPSEDYDNLLPYFFHKNQYLFRKCNFDGRGNAIQLINVIKHDTFGIEASCSYDVKDKAVYNLAAIFMIGERPTDSIIEPKEMWDFRCSEHPSYIFNTFRSLHQLMQRPRDMPYSTDSDSDY